MSRLSTTAPMFHLLIGANFIFNRILRAHCRQMAPWFAWSPQRANGGESGVYFIVQQIHQKISIPPDKRPFITARLCDLCTYVLLIEPQSYALYVSAWSEFTLSFIHSVATSNFIDTHLYIRLREFQQDAFVYFRRSSPSVYHGIGCWTQCA